MQQLAGPLPEKGLGTAATVEALLRVGTATATASAGPRFYHFVIGGSTPASLAADWTVSLLDQNAAMRASSNLAHEVETVVLGWLRELVGLPPGWGGALAASATFANFTSLALATHWWGERHGVDVAVTGLVGLPRMPVLSGGYVHPSARKALQMLGHGRDTVEVFARDVFGRVDLAGMNRRLGELAGAPAVIIGNAGEVNAGDFDPLATSPIWPSGIAPGCTSTVPSASSRRSRLVPHTSSGVWSARTRSPPTRTNGSTYPTRAGSLSCVSRSGSVGHSGCRAPPICPDRMTHAAATCSSARSRRGGRVPCRSGRRSPRTGGRAIVRLWSATAISHGT